MPFVKMTYMQHLSLLNILHPQISHNIKTTDKWSECHWSFCYDATFCWCGFWCTRMFKPLESLTLLLNSWCKAQDSSRRPVCILPTDQSTIITIFCRFVSLFWLNWCITRLLTVYLMMSKQKTHAECCDAFIMTVYITLAHYLWKQPFA